MDKEVHGESFSSQNVNLEVTDIRRGANGEVVQFGFSDGSSFFIHPQASLEFSVRVGTVFTDEQLKRVLLRSAEFAARDKGLEYLSAREHTVSELILKLRKKGYDQDTAGAGVEMLIERGYVSDQRFAEQWVRSRLKKHPEGRSSLLAGLARKGVNRRLAEAVLDEHLSDDIMDDALARCIEKYTRTRTAEPKKLINHLLRLGFRYGDIKRHMAGLDEFNEENGMEFSNYE
jgi:regulatory protein